MEHVAKKWGYEEIIVNLPAYCGKRLTVLPNGFACSVHFHKTKQETFHVLEGHLQLEVYERLLPSAGLSLPSRHILWPGECLTLDPFIPHRFWAINKVVRFLEFSTHDDPADSYRLIEAGPIPK